MSLEPNAALVDALNTAARGVMSYHRYLHVLGVTHTAAAICIEHNLPPFPAAAAGLLHDVSKEIDCEEIARDLRRLGQPLTQEDSAHEKTWHGLHAAAIAPSRFGLADPDVLRAVAQHTTGDAEMSSLSQILFVADFCEPTRKRAEAAEVRALARIDYSAAFRRALDLKTRHMLAKPAFELHPRTLRAIQGWLPERARESAWGVTAALPAGGA